MSYSKPHSSTATQLRHQLSSLYQIEPAEIMAEHISSVYKEMPNLATSAKSTQISELADSLEPAHHYANEVCGVIVETRSHPALADSVESVIDACKIPVQLYHGSQNHEFILDSKLKPLIDKGKIYLTNLNTNSLTANKYNALMMNVRFWRSMIARGKVLIFQADSLCCKESDYALMDFLDFDYIGGSWNPQRPVGLTIHGGNGGFSLRDWRRSIECIQRFPPSLWGGGEDGYFAFHLDLIGAKVASIDESATFAAQDTFNYKSFGAHAIYRLSKSKQTAFFDYSSLAKQIFIGLYNDLLNHQASH